jgi:hypothetical protein
VEQVDTWLLKEFLPRSANEMPKAAQREIKLAKKQELEEKEDARAQSPPPESQSNHRVLS